MPRVLLVLTIAAWMATAGSAAAALPAALPGHIAFEAGPNSPVTVGAVPRAIAVGYIDANGTLDFATANGNADSVTPVYGNGSGGFTAGPAVTVGDDPRGIVIADLDGDGRGDIATANLGADTVSVLIQNTGGGFDALEPVSSQGNGPAAIAAGRMDAGDSLDLVVANGGAGTGSGPLNVAVLLNDGAGNLSPPEGLPSAGAVTESLVLGDFDEDGDLDAVTDGVWIHPGVGDGTVGPAKQIADSGPRRIVAGDLDGDGHLDLLAGGGGNTTNPIVLLGRGGGGFHAQEELPFSATGPFRPTGFAIGRFNADPYGDLMASSRGSIPGPVSRRAATRASSSVMTTVA